MGYKLDFLISNAQKMKAKRMKKRHRPAAVEVKQNLQRVKNQAMRQVNLEELL